MKIKFLKPFRLYNPIGDDMMMGEGTVENMEKEDYAKWLIDNGFAEEVKESGWWKPKFNEEYYFVSNTGNVQLDPWGNDEVDEYRYSMGGCFKTNTSAKAWITYLKAVATVSQDEGFMAPFGQLDKGRYGFGIFYDWAGNLCAEEKNHRVLAGEFYFDNKENAEKSIDSHPNEWKIILNYDWSRE